MEFEFKIFAEFSSPIQDGYLKLLEGLSWRSDQSHHSSRYVPLFGRGMFHGHALSPEFGEGGIVAGRRAYASSRRSVLVAKRRS
jgi:hypothetical protein